MGREDNVQRALRYLKDSGVFYVATVEGDQPRVRPFGAVAEFEGRLYIVTNNQKKCFDQMLKQPKIEISATGKDRSWLRVAALAVRDSRREAKTRVLDENPSLRSLYSEDDGKLEVLYLKDAQGAVYVFGKEPEAFSF